MAAFLSKLRNLPTPLFEAKPQRAVYLNEFKAAVVPAETSETILNALRDAGVDVFTYENDEARKATLQFVTQEKKLRFSLDNYDADDVKNIVAFLRPKHRSQAFVEPSEVKAYLAENGFGDIEEQDAWSFYQRAGMEIHAEQNAIQAELRKRREKRREKWIMENYDLIAKVAEFAGNGTLDSIVLRPAFRHKDNDEWPGTFIAKEWRERGKLKPQGKMSDAQYLKYKMNRDYALEHAHGKATDELAQEIANKYGGDPLDIEEEIIETFRNLKKPDLYSAYSPRPWG